MMNTQSTIHPYSLKDAPAFIERLLPVQKLSVESYKEQMAVHGKTLTALGSYWKGRKPLILAKACILGCLLPATSDLQRDLEVFEMLMAMDDASFVVRLGRRPSIESVVSHVVIGDLNAVFDIEPMGVLPRRAPLELLAYGTIRHLRDGTLVVDERKQDKVDSGTRHVLPITIKWKEDLPEAVRRRIEAQVLERQPYRSMVATAVRPEEVQEIIHDHIWESVNSHLGTSAGSIPELVEQLGLMRFGHRPRFADMFCGSGQIPFEAARLGFDVYASDLNPVACMLTWGALSLVGGSKETREQLKADQAELISRVKAEINALGVESDGDGWTAKAFLYCAEVRCPQTGWMVPLLQSRIVSNGYRVIADLIPDIVNKRYEIRIRSGVGSADMKAAETGTLRREGKYGEAYLVHSIDGVSYKTKISTLRGDHETNEGVLQNNVRHWDKLEFMARPDDLIQERLYCVQWMRKKKQSKSDEYEFRSVGEDDLRRESIVQEYVANHLVEWQHEGCVPDMRIEVGGPPRYQGLDLVRARGWTYWHHLFNPRQLMLAGLANRCKKAACKVAIAQLVNWNSRLSTWNRYGGGGGIVQHTFSNQALNTLFDYGCRSFEYARGFLQPEYKSFPLDPSIMWQVEPVPANTVSHEADIVVTDPPYGDAVKYEEILDFFIGWLRKNPPSEFSSWIWDSRRSLAIKGEDDSFRQAMVDAYRTMTANLPDNGIQVIMFTHQSGTIWADMANIVWAAGLHVTAAWYVVTEADSALREGAHVKGTVMLVVRKRQGSLRITSDDLAWDIQDEVKEQVETLTGLNQSAQGLYRDESLFEDADLQMAGYAAALRVLTRYAVIDGKDMTVEALRPRIKGQATFVDELIDFAVSVANQFLVPQGIERGHWEKLAPAERFYLKLIDLEARGIKTLDNYQNFAKAFKVSDYRTFMASQRANAARLKSAAELGRSEMTETSEFGNTALRGVLYAMMELVKETDGDETLRHLALNVPDWHDPTQRALVVELADYLARKLPPVRPEEAAAARVLSELVRNQRL